MRGDDNPSRLADHPGLDPWVVGLLRSREPYRAQPGRKQRVLLSFGRRNPGRAPRVLRPAIVAGVLIGCGAFASAAIGPWRGWIARAYQRVVPSSRAEAPLAVAERARGHQAVAAPSPAPGVPSPAPGAPPPVEAPPASPPAPVPARGSSPALRPHHLAPLVAAPPPGEQDTQAVLEGMRALRLDRDPVRARALLARYLDRQPNGALAEEALALSIEAAVAHHDADAPALAARYLRRYPAGAFVALAREAQR